MMRGLVNGIGGTVMRVQGARTTEDAYAEAEKDNDKLRAEIERLRSWMYEAINSLGDPQDACDHQDSEVAALRATIDEAIGKLRTGLADANEQSEPPLVHVGRDGQPHNGPRAACTICFMWDQIASNEQNGDGK